MTQREGEMRYFASKSGSSRAGEWKSWNWYSFSRGNSFCLISNHDCEIGTWHFDMMIEAAIMMIHGSNI